MPRIVKDCFGTVISNLTKMKECVRCELLSECRSINWAAAEAGLEPVVNHRPLQSPLKAGEETDVADTPGAGRPA